MSGHAFARGRGYRRPRIRPCRGAARGLGAQVEPPAPGRDAAAPQPVYHPPRGRSAAAPQPVYHPAPGRDAAAPQPVYHPAPGSGAAAPQQWAHLAWSWGAAASPQHRNPDAGVALPQLPARTPPARVDAGPQRSAIQRRKKLASAPQRPEPSPPAMGAEAHPSPTSQKHHSAGSSSSEAEATPDIALLRLGGTFSATGVQPAFPKRPNHCQARRTVTVTANHFEVTLPKDGSVYHYDVDITKVVPADIPQPFIPKDRKHEVFERFVKLHWPKGHPVFDGQKNMYACTQLQQPAQPPSVTMGSDEYSVSVQRVAELKFSHVVAFYSANNTGTRLPRALIQALDIMLRYQARLRTLWSAQDPRAIPIRGVELFHCLFTSLRAGQSRTYVNVDTKLVAFHQSGNSLLQLVRRRTGCRLDSGPQSDITLNKISDKLKGMKIYVNNLSFTRHYVLKRFTRESANVLTLSGSKQSVASYFAEKYTRLQYPYAPCVEVVSKQQCYFPVEVCFANPKQKCERGLDDNEAKVFKSRGNLNPTEKFKLTVEAVSKLVQPPEYTNAFRISVATEPVTFEAKVLAKPSGITDIPYMDPKGATTMVRGTIVNACSTTTLQDEEVDEFSNRLQNNAKGLNISMETSLIHEGNLESLRSIEKMLTEATEPAGARFVVVFIILDGKNSPHYNSIKLVAETWVGVITQCVAADSVRGKLGDKIAKNIMRKVRAKIGCLNVLMPENVNGFNFEDVMVVGADVTHPGPTEKNTPSVAAVVASVNKLASRYVAALRIQKKDEEARARVEIIQDMRGIAESLLREYTDRNGNPPGKILFYRDGVSEGQFDHVCRHEVNSLQAACDQLRPGYRPLITFVSVQKRHRTRIVATNPKYDNVVPGTVVDTTITHPVDFDFFLCPHKPKAGSTARLAHYYVLRDDNRLSAETLQTITLGLCNAYVRCDTPVSIPAPVYYAHHATKRALGYVRAAHGGDNAVMPSVKALEDTIKVQGAIEKSMYFV